MGVHRCSPLSSRTGRAKSRAKPGDLVMPRLYDRLSPTTVKAKDLAPGRYPDGGSLYLSVGREGQRRWTFLYKCRASGRPREMGLGSAGKAGVTLAEARRKAAAARSLLADGI